MFMVYCESGIFASPTLEEIDQATASLQNSKCNIEDQGNLNDYLGVNVHVTEQGTFLTQPHLINQIESNVGILTQASRS